MNRKGFAKSVIGGREMNQDSFLVEDDLGIYAVADGIGGGLKGDVASQMSVAGLKKKWDPLKTMTQIVTELQEEVYQDAMTNFGEPLMGTTFTCVRVDGDKATLCHVGDSRLYYFDGNLMRQMTQDHERYEESLQGSVLCSYLGLDTKAHPFMIQEETFSVVAGSRLLLCSDGLYKQMSENRTAALIRENFADASLLLDKLCDEASKAEYSDNITIVYIEIEA